jgi:hypothetical protein
MLEAMGTSPVGKKNVERFEPYANTGKSFGKGAKRLLRG